MRISVPFKGWQMVPLQGVNSPSRIWFHWHPDWKVLVGIFIFFPVSHPVY